MLQLTAKLLTKYQSLRLALDVCIQHKYILKKNNLNGKFLTQVLEILDNDTLQLIYNKEKLATVTGKNVFLLVLFDRNLAGNLSLKEFQEILIQMKDIGQIKVSPFYHNGERIKLKIQ